MARKKGGHTGGHGWFVTFADLMALLMSFFVMVAAFSSQDKQKLQIVAGSMREAFGVQKVAYNGLVEQDGVPTKPSVKNVARIDPEDSTNTPGPNDLQQQVEGMKARQDRSFALAAASLRQAMQEMPEISELSKHIMIEVNEQGLNIEIVDQDGRSMFPDGAKEPYERTRRIIQKFAGPLKALPNRLSVTGHTAASRVPPRPGYGAWELSPTGPIRCARSSRTRACRRRICSWWPERPTASRCSRTIPTSRPIAALPSRSCARLRRCRPDSSHSVGEGAVCGRPDTNNCNPSQFALTSAPQGAPSRLLSGGPTRCPVHASRCYRYLVNLHCGSPSAS
jgi:chemotaxis protein MotB